MSNSIDPSRIAPSPAPATFRDLVHHPEIFEGMSGGDRVLFAISWAVWYGERAEGAGKLPALERRRAVSSSRGERKRQAREVEAMAQAMDALPDDDCEVA